MTDEQEIEVIATRDGLYGTYRKTGERFTVEASKVSKRWMVPANSKEAKAFEQAHKADKNADRDRITGERIASGGLSEQLAVALEENAVLKARIAELEAAAPKKPETREEVEEPGQTGGDDTVAAAAPITRRRRTAAK